MTVQPGDDPVGPPSPVPIREKGYAADPSLASFWTDLTHEETPELRWPMSVLVYDRMRRQDAQVSSVLRAVTSPILRTRWSIDGTGCREEVTKFVASNLGLPIKGEETGGDFTAQLRGRDRFSWNQHTKLALTCIPFGHAFFEQQYRYDQDGRARIRKLAFRPQRTVGRVNVARDGGLVSIQQWPAGTAGWATLWSGGTTATVATGAFEDPIPVNRLVAYVVDREGGNWLGISSLRAAYKNWLLKDRALRIWLIAIERNGAGVPIYVGADGEQDLAKGKQLAQSIRAGEQAGGAIPHGAQMLLQGVTGVTVDIGAFVRYQDEQIARAVLAHFLNLGTQTGSWALGKSFKDFFTLSLQATAGDHRDVSNDHIVEDLVDINFGRSEPAPQIQFEEIGSETEIDKALSNVRTAAGLENDDDLAKFIREHVPGAAAA